MSRWAGKSGHGDGGKGVNTGQEGVARSGNQLLGQVENSEGTW